MPLRENANGEQVPPLNKEQLTRQTAPYTEIKGQQWIKKKNIIDTQQKDETKSLFFNFKILLVF